MAEKQPNNYIVLELKKILRVKNLQTVGNKRELIDRLTNYDPNIWSIMDDERRREQVIDRSINEGEGSRERSASGIGERDEENVSGINERDGRNDAVDCGMFGGL